MAEGGFGPTLYMRTSAWWDKQLGDGDGVVFMLSCSASEMQMVRCPRLYRIVWLQNRRKGKRKTGDQEFKPSLLHAATGYLALNIKCSGRPTGRS
jgi:hypothetical protein